MRLNVTKPFSVKIGSFKEPFSLEEAASNRYLTFIERHMAVNSFVDNPNTYKTGIGVNYAVPRFQFGVAFQTEPVGPGLRLPPRLMPLATTAATMVRAIPAGKASAG